MQNTYHLLSLTSGTSVTSAIAALKMKSNILVHAVIFFLKQLTSDFLKSMQLIKLSSSTSAIDVAKIFNPCPVKLALAWAVVAHIL